LAGIWDTDGWIDISLPLRQGMTGWPGDPPYEIKLVRSIERGDAFNLSKISLGVHCGTHLDSPLHFFRDGRDISSMPLESVIGKARVVEIKDSFAIKPSELVEHQIQNGERILFKTLNSKRNWPNQPFREDFISISKEAAGFLAQKRLKAVGMDYLSVGPSNEDGVEVHRSLLEAGTWLIEGLNLEKVGPGQYWLVCLPLNLVSAEGAPARAILKPI
jgi:arylformamidase